LGSLPLRYAKSASVPVGHPLYRFFDDGRGLIGASKMKKFIVAALAALVAAAAPVANARDDEPSPEVIKEFASNYMRQFSLVV